MQILAGKYKRKRLQSATSPKVRPTARRLRESLFELLGLRIENSRFLDLCAGSGAVGIEALSRGAAHATFVDRSLKMCSFIESNLELCGVPPEQTKVLADEATHFLHGAGGDTDAAWDIAFFDPPYAADYLSVIELFTHNGLLKSRGGVLVVEHHCDNQLGERFSSLQRWRVIRQGESCLSFYERKK
ncbi:MAG TPA: 16S rRNA (guanine(966)-N(2))-methyltransferase RsmD [Pyrinomonadaceae bacterium]|jgi:16S rRNA (guanine(966)-N(2))-methyltransferase RsmD